MKPVLTAEEEALLVAAIREQEARTSAEIRICVSYRAVFNAESFAWWVFEKAGMRDTRRRNAALIVLLPRVKQIVVIGDSGFDAVVPADFWKQTVAAMVRQMQEEGPLAALVAGLQRLGDTLTLHWPRTDDDVNELADGILR